MRPLIKAIGIDVAWTLLHKEAMYDDLADLFNSFQPKGRFTETQLRTAHRAVSEAWPISDKATDDDYRVVNSRLCEILGISWGLKLDKKIGEICRSHKWLPYEDAHAPFQVDLPVYVFSNWKSGLGKYLKSKLNVEIRGIVCSAEEGIQKPDINFYRLCAERTGFTPPEILFVGDSLNLDYFPSNSLGFYSVLLDRWGLYSESNFRRISNLAKLDDWID